MTAKGAESHIPAAASGPGVVLLGDCLGILGGPWIVVRREIHTRSIVSLWLSEFLPDFEFILDLQIGSGIGF